MTCAESAASTEPLRALQRALGHGFKSPALLAQALTHRSFSADHNERLEFLGDSILNCAVSELLYQRLPKEDEGRLSRIRSHLVRQECLAKIAEQLHLAPMLRLGEGEVKSGGRSRPSILADAVEALVGAIFLDAGFDAARTCVLRLITPVFDQQPAEELGKDAKTGLQEWLQARKHPLPQYAVVQEGGHAHRPEFVVSCTVSGYDVHTQASGFSRKEAEQKAAFEALDALKRLPEGKQIPKTPTGRRP